MMEYSKWKKETGKWQISEGFTLIELLVVFGIIGIVSSFGFAGFASFNNNQTLQVEASEIKNMLQLARTRALAQVKPQQCTNETLSGYQVNLNTTTSQYSLIVVCDERYTVETKKLPNDITFRSDSATGIFFPVLTGTPSSSSKIILQGYGKIYVVQIDASGTIALLANASLATQPLLPTPTSVDCPWQEWWTCGSGGLTVAPTFAPTSIPTPTSTIPTPTPTRIPTSTPTPTVVPVLNALTNGNFELGNANWSDWGNSGAVSTNVHGGSYSMRVGTGAGGRYQNIGNNGSGNYTLSGWGKVSTSTEDGTIGVHYLNSAGMQIGRQALTYSSTAYIYQQLALTIPSGTTTIQAWVWKDAGSGGYFYADDLQLTTTGAIVPTPTPTSAPPADIIIDNTVASVVGTWTTATSSTDKYGSDYRYHSAGSGSNYLRYTPNITRAGYYNVYEWHPAGANRPTNAQHVVSHNGTTNTVTVNQEINGGRWNLLGNFYFATGTGGNVRITDVFSGDSSTVVMADAIKFVWSGTSASTPVPPTPTPTPSCQWNCGGGWN